MCLFTVRFFACSQAKLMNDRELNSSFLHELHQTLKHTLQYALLDYKYPQSGTKVVDTVV